MQIRVYYEDTDLGGIVYHSTYINYCERARSNAFFEKGMSPVLKTGHFVARKLEADFLMSAKLGDLLDIKTKLLQMKSASFKLHQSIYKDDKKIFELSIILAYIAFDGKPQKIDANTKELITSLF